MLPKEAVTGPHGIGEPDDRSLRKIEANVVIPNMMNKRIEQTECKSEIEELIRCMKREGAALGLQRCKEFLGVFNVCKQKKYACFMFFMLF